MREAGAAGRKRIDRHHFVDIAAVRTHVERPVRAALSAGLAEGADTGAAAAEGAVEVCQRWSRIAFRGVDGLDEVAVVAVVAIAPVPL